MKWVLLAVLLLGAAFAGSTLTRGDFSYSIDGGAVKPLGSGETVLEAKFTLTRPMSVAYNVSVALKPPTGVRVVGGAAKEAGIIKSGRTTTVGWTVAASTEGTYDFSDAFEVVSWDDSASLILDMAENPVPGLEQLEPSEGLWGAYPTDSWKVTISGTTDPSACQNQSGAARPEDCFTKILISGEEPILAAADGSFSKAVALGRTGFSLDPDFNLVAITAEDPGGNTDSTKVLFVYRNPLAAFTYFYAPVVLLLALLAFVAFRWYQGGAKEAEEEVGKIRALEDEAKEADAKLAELPQRRKEIEFKFLKRQIDDASRREMLQALVVEEESLKARKAELERKLARGD